MNPVHEAEDQLQLFQIAVMSSNAGFYILSDAALTLPASHWLHFI